MLYNTSVSALLQHGEKMLDKMADVFSVFRERQKQTALLWRPHPLTLSTLQAMRPELLGEFSMIRQIWIVRCCCAMPITATEAAWCSFAKIWENRF